MSSSVLGDSIMLIGVLIAAVVLSQGFITSMTVMQRGSIETSRYLSDQIKTNVKILLVEKDGGTVKIWVKNTGSKQLGEVDVQAANIFFGKSSIGCYLYKPAGAGWTYTILSGASYWNPNETIEVTLTPSGALDNGQYYVSFITYNGVKDEYTYSLG